MLKSTCFIRSKMKADFKNGIKFCSCCKEFLSIDMFYKNKSTNDFLSQYCKICSKIKNRKSRNKKFPIDLDFSEKLKLQAELKLDNKKFCKKCGFIKDRSDFFNDKSKGKDGKSTWCKQCHSLWKEGRRQNPSSHENFLSIKSRARYCEKKFEVSEEDYLEMSKQDCVYCSEPSNGGIDRIDSDIGYTYENIQPCCTICNRMKMDHSDEFFREHLIKIVKNLELKT